MRHKNISYAKYGYIFSIPFVIAFLIFTFYPVIYTVAIGFTDLKGLGVKNFRFLANPFQNYQLILKNVLFRRSLFNTAFIWIMNFIPQMLLALLLAAWFSNYRTKLTGQGAFKVMMYMPNIITAATMAILFNVLFGYPKGPVNDLLMGLGLNSKPYNFLVHKLPSQSIIAFIQFWMWYGYTMIVLIAGIMGIDPTLFEAAEIDGANPYQIFFRITLPSLRTILLYTLVTSLIGGLQMFDIPKLFNQGNPDNSTLTTSVFIYNQAFSGSYMYNRASAASMLLFLIIAVLSAIVFYLLRDKEAIKQEKYKKALIREAKMQQKRNANNRAEEGVV